MNYGKLFQYKLDHENLLTIESADKLPTHRLLTYFKKYRTMRYAGICGCCGERYPRDEDQKQYYDDCGIYIDQLKKILDNREHV